MSNIFIIFVILCFSLCIKDHSDSNTNKKLSRTGIINMLESLNETYSWCLVDVFFNRQSACLWVLIVLLFSLIWFVIVFPWGRIHRETSQDKWKEAIPILLIDNFPFCNIDDVLSINKYKLSDYVDRRVPIDIAINIWSIYFSVDKRDCGSYHEVTWLIDSDCCKQGNYWTKCS